MGGEGAAGQRDARNVAFRTTALALNVEPGTIARVDDWIKAGRAVALPLKQTEPVVFWTWTGTSRFAALRKVALAAGP